MYRKKKEREKGKPSHAMLLPASVDGLLNAADDAKGCLAMERTKGNPNPCRHFSPLLQTAPKRRQSLRR
jgi:hypothetical protein